MAQREPVPHLQVPAEQVSARVPQSVQARPPVPHAAVAVPAEQELPLQHPEAQLLALQTQVPRLHTWPAAQALPLPHLHPPVVQLSAVLPQAVQLAPVVPQLASVGGVTQEPELPPLQQPLAQLVPSQTQTPAAQRLPAAHRAVPPQRQPVELQESARAGSQALHAAPLVPHWVTVTGVMQVAPLQHPDAQLVELQPTQAWAVQLPPPQEAHAPPPVPHSVESVPALHWPEALQQPIGQLVASQTHVPPEQRCPVAQAAPAPQAQAPAVQRSDFVSHVPQDVAGAPQAAVLWLAGATQVVPLQQPPGHEVALHTQVPPEQVWPLPQAAPAPHLHAPLVQVLVLPEQGPHAAPPVPQAAALCPAPVRHTPALQQPVGQLVASQTQTAAAEHRWPARHALAAPHLHAPPVQRSAVVPHAAQVCPPV